jgi:hypothetical protein
MELNHEMNMSSLISLWFDNMCNREQMLIMDWLGLIDNLAN